MKFEEALKIGTTFEEQPHLDWSIFYEQLSRPEPALKLLWRVNKKEYPEQVKALKFLLRKRTREKFLAWIKLQQ